MTDKSTNGYSELKRRALLAKQRLKMGYWQQMYEERQKTLEEMSGNGDSERLCR